MLWTRMNIFVKHALQLTNKCQIILQPFALDKDKSTTSSLNEGGKDIPLNSLQVLAFVKLRYNTARELNYQ